MGDLCYILEEYISIVTLTCMYLDDTYVRKIPINLQYDILLYSLHYFWVFVKNNIVKWVIKTSILYLS